MANARGPRTAIAPAAPASSVCSEIVLGSVLSFTGRYSTGGVHTRNGYEFAAATINSAGGIRIGQKCYRLRILYYDDESSEKRGAEMAEHLIKKDGVRYLLGPYGPEIANAVAPVAVANSVPVLLAQDVGRSLNERGNRYRFALRTLTEQHLAVAVDLAAEVARNVGHRASPLRMAIATLDDEPGRELALGVRRRAVERDMEIVVDERLSGDLEALVPMLAKVKRLEPDLLVVSAHARAARAAMAEIVELQVHAPMVVMTHCEAARLVEEFGAGANNVLCARDTMVKAGDGIFENADVFDKAIAAAVERYEESSVPDAARRAALAVRIFADAIGRAGSLEPERVTTALAATDLKTYAGTVRFGPNGERFAPPLLL
ncbi:MAG: ABC transporter substrate-binding protein, partial [Alphaproteobacteria bacterium]|nr:ABC transporter substrate-binding protein [Alphaproteobacteria bacterium]